MQATVQKEVSQKILTCDITMEMGPNPMGELKIASKHSGLDCDRAPARTEKLLGLRRITRRQSDFSKV